ncbi:MAG: hypothetical protein V3T92_02635 [Anaerolineae bacterium]
MELTFPHHILDLQLPFLSPAAIAIRDSPSAILSPIFSLVTRLGNVNWMDVSALISSIPQPFKAKVERRAIRHPLTL